MQGQPVGNVPGTFGPGPSRLYDTNTGAEIPGSGIAEYAYMPQFSVDGTQIVFNQMDTSGTPAGHTLAVMDFDRASIQFNDERAIFNDATQFPGWPFFLPEAGMSLSMVTPDQAFTSAARHRHAGGESCSYLRESE
jgi:hypothetical protein